MNIVSLTGRITHDLELKSTKNLTKYVGFQLAVNAGKDKANFIRCKAWNDKAEFMANHLSKGKLIEIVGSIVSDKDQNGNTSMEVWVSNIGFLEKKDK